MDAHEGEGGGTYGSHALCEASSVTHSSSGVIKRIPQRPLHILTQVDGTTAILIELIEDGSQLGLWGHWLALALALGCPHLDELLGSQLIGAVFVGIKEVFSSDTHLGVVVLLTCRKWDVGSGTWGVGIGASSKQGQVLVRAETYPSLLLTPSLLVGRHRLLRPLLRFGRRDSQLLLELNHWVQCSVVEWARCSVVEWVQCSVAGPQCPVPTQCPVPSAQCPVPSVLARYAPDVSSDNAKTVTCQCVSVS